MLVVLVTLTPDHRKEFIVFQKAKLPMAVLPGMDVKTLGNFTLLLLDRTYQFRTSKRVGLQNPKYTDYRPLFTTQHEWAMVKYVMEVLRPF